jgi:hypothetical protein
MKSVVSLKGEKRIVSVKLKHHRRKVGGVTIDTKPQPHELLTPNYRPRPLTTDH